MASQLEIGFGKIDYTPDFSVGLGGYGGDFKRSHVEVVMPVYITCIAAKQDGVTALVYTVDTCGFRKELADLFREAIEKATGVPGSHIVFGGTHGHNCPSTAPLSHPIVAQLVERMQAAAVEAAKVALEDLAPAKIFGAKPVFPGLNFTRHYRMPGGKRSTTNTGITKEMVTTGHLGPSDPQMVMVKFAREEKEDVLLCNWQAHPDDAYQIGFNKIAPGYPGPFRDQLETISGCRVAFFQGASGNQVRDSRHKELSHGLNWENYGIHLARKAYGAFNQFVPVEADGIFVTRHMLTVNVNHSEDDKLEAAREIDRLLDDGQREKAIELLEPNGIRSLSHASGILMRGTMKQTGELELNALRIGQVGFAVNTCETFSDQGLYIKNYSPFEFTFMVTGNRSYLPCNQAYDYPCYEVIGGSGYYARGTAEAMADKLVQMLCEIV